MPCPPARRSATTRRRFAWLGADVVLETPDTETLTRQTRVLIARNTAQTATARRGLAISGSAGRGKSTAALLIGRRHERMMRTKLGRDDDGFAPVVYTVVPPGTTPKMMMLAFANFLGLLVPGQSHRPRPHRTNRRCHARPVGFAGAGRRGAQPEDQPPGGSDAASALKVFSERLDATFIYAGIDLLQADLFAGHMGRQLKGRMALYQMRTYGYGTKAQRDTWAELVLGIEALLPLGRHAAGSLETEVAYLYDRTGGSIGSLRALLSDAAIAAILGGEEQVGRKLLDMTSTDYAAEEYGSRTAEGEPASPRPLKRAE